MNARAATVPPIPHSLSPQMRLEWQLALAHYQRACGCETAAAGAAIGFIGALLLLAASIVHLTLANAAGAIAGLAAASVVGAIVGKHTGLERARRRYARETSRLAGG